MRGPIAYMAGNSVAANLLMALILVVGFVSVGQVAQEVFPESSLDAVQVRVPYPGASPNEVEDGIVRRVEEQLESLEDVRRIRSVASENVGVVTVEFEFGVDISEKLDEVKAEIDRIVTFPVDAEKPEVRELTNQRQVMQLAVYGDIPERALKELAFTIKDELTAFASFVDVSGVRNYEISIEVSNADLQSYGLGVLDVASAIRRASLDLPGGVIETAGEEVLIRTQGQNYVGRDFEEIVLLTTPDGTLIRLADVATVRDGFEEADLLTRFDGRPSALVQVYRSSDERVLDVVAAIKAHLETQIRPSLPEGAQVSIWQDESKLLKSRYQLLIKNGVAGLILVILSLALFLNGRLAFWVSVGIFISFLGAFGVMYLMGVSINLISLFAFILALGIVVDDAIVIGEGIHFESEAGRSPLEASIQGAARLGTPVIFAVLTTVAAFSPLLFVPGAVGKFMRNVPIIMIAVLVFSLVESLFILPAHLSHGRRASKEGWISQKLGRVQRRLSGYIDWMVNGPLDRALRFTTHHWGVIIAGAVAMMILSVGLVAGGLLRFTFFPAIEGENVIARIELPQGTSAEETARLAADIEAAGERVAARLQATLSADHPALVKHIFTIVGDFPSLDGGPSAGGGPGLIQSHIAEINMELLEAESRDISAKRFEQAWREEVGVIPAARSLQFQSAIFQVGKPIQAEVSGPNEQHVEEVRDRMKEALGLYAGVYNVEDDLIPGKREIKLQLKPGARALGLTVDDLARQVRASYYGAEALRVQRGREDLRVFVRLPETDRDALGDLDRLRIRTPNGAEVPFSEVATATFGDGPSALNRRDRRRVVTVSADVNEAQGNAQEIIAAIQSDLVPTLQSSYPGLRVSFEGEQREQADTFAALGRGFLIALFVIYALLAIPFRSYTQPLIIMMAIPFGIIGALLGHAFLGLDVTILSMFGIIGLSGVVVNDSLVLIDYINERHRSGQDLSSAVMEGAKVRFRPILLTSLTTFLGVLPLILERSLQAQFLIPLAVSLGFGILMATFILMLLVPALVMAFHALGLHVQSLSRLSASEVD